MHESLQMCTFLERKLYEIYDGDIDCLPKITIFEKIAKRNHHFLAKFSV